MKKLLMSFIGFLIALMTSILSFAEATPEEKPDIKMIINGTQSQFEKVPIIIAGRTLLPLRPVLTSLGVENDDNHIIWNAAKRSVTVIKDGKKVFLAIGDNNATIDGVQISMDVSPIIYNDSTYIPVRFISQSLNKKVLWEPLYSSVMISDIDNYNSVKEITNKTDLTTKENKIRINTHAKIEKKNNNNMEVSIVEEEDPINKVEHQITRASIDNKNYENEKYIKANIEYSRELPDGIWTKIDITDILPVDSRINESEDEAFNMGMVVKNSPNEHEIVLEGDFCLNSLVQEFKFNSVNGSHMKMVIDKNTNFVKEISVAISGKSSFLSDNEEDSTVTVSIISEYLQDTFEITVPQEAISVDVKNNFEPLLPDNGKSERY